MATKRKPKESSTAKVLGLAELTALCRREFTVELSIDGTPVSVPVRYLTPAQSAQVDRLLNEALPPLRVQSPGDDPEYDYNDKTYLESLRDNKKKARALALYWGCPLYHDARPGLSEVVIICQYVQEESELPESVMERLFAAIVNEERIEARVNFTSGGDSPSS